MMGLCRHGVKLGGPPDRVPIREVDASGEATRLRMVATVRRAVKPLAYPFPSSVGSAPTCSHILAHSLGERKGFWDGCSILNVPQIGLVSTSRMNAAPLTQESSASSAEAEIPSGPTRIT
jgi:hypothetical protein